MDAHTADVAQQVSDYVRYWRTHAGMSVVDAAEQSGLGRSKWTEIEQAKGALAKPDTLGRVARTIGRDPGELLALIGISPPSTPSTNGHTPRPPMSIEEQLAAILGHLTGSPSREDFERQLTELTEAVRDAARKLSALDATVARVDKTVSKVDRAVTDVKRTEAVVRSLLESSNPTATP